MSAYTELMRLVGRILTSTEMTNLRLAIATGASMILRGKYTEEDVKRQARRICSIIRGAHILEISELEQSLKITFIDACTDLITAATLEQVLLSSGRIRFTPITSETRGETRGEMSLLG